MDLDISDLLLAILALCVPLALYTATIEMREDMLNPEPRFPKNMLRRLLCWILMSISLVFFWVTILVLMALQATLIIIGLPLMEIGRVLNLAVGSFPPLWVKTIQEGLSERVDVWVNGIVCSSIWFSGGFLERPRHVDTEEGFDEVDSTSDEDLETLAKSVD
ncbi:hypothetical protein K456DRAFT_38701 [Colletotrichum gloeosporioides 23]|nr:hypothetical protein K456DRAFT_38701 [Colletotrichum gloeosporioides 23]